MAASFLLIDEFVAVGMFEIALFYWTKSIPKDLSILRSNWNNFGPIYSSLYARKNSIHTAYIFWDILGYLDKEEG